MLGAQHERRPTTVLIADNRAEDRRQLRVVLEGMGHTVVETSNGQEALASIRTARPDVIVSAVLMPGVDGFELCRQLQQDPDLRHVPCVFTTATSGPQYAELAQDVGAVRLILKPVDP